MHAPSFDRLPSSARRVVLAACALLVACGGATQQAAPGPRAPSAAAPVPPSPPPLPDEPLQLLPAGARVLGRADLDQMRSSPDFATLQQWAERYACVSGRPAQALLQHTQRVAFALFAGERKGAPARGLLLLRGDYADADARTALDQACVWSAAACTQVSAEQRGRFELLDAGPLAAAQLGPHLIALGTGPLLGAVLEVADGARPSWAGSDPLMRGLDTTRWLFDHTLAAVAQLDDRSARRIGDELASVGGAELGSGLANGSAALALVLAQDARAELRVLYPQAETAARTAAAVRSLSGQAGLVMRLMGLPPWLERMQVQTSGSLLTLSLALSADDVKSLRERVGMLLQGKPAQCQPAGPRADARANPAQGWGPGGFADGAGRARALHDELTQHPVSAANPAQGWGPGGFADGAGRARALHDELTQHPVSAANPAQGWGPGGFADGAGRARALHDELTQHPVSAANPAQGWGPGGFADGAGRARALHDELTQHPVSAANPAQGWGPGGFADGAGRARALHDELTQHPVSAANPAQGWGPGGFADGAGRARALPVN